MLGHLTGFPIKCFGLGQWRLNLTRQQESKCSLWCIPGSHIYSLIFKGNVCFKGIIAIMFKTQRREWNLMESLLWFLDFRLKPKASNVSHLWFLWPTVSLCVCVPACALNGCLEESVNGFVEFCFRGTNADMRSPRALVIMRECIVAVFKTWQLTASTAGAQWMQALESWLELASANNVKQCRSGNVQQLAAGRGLEAP